MANAHLQSGGRYPVLRSIGIIYLYMAAVFAIGGVVFAGYVLFSGWTNPLLPFSDRLSGRLMTCIVALASTALLVISMLAVAELLKLLIDIEHNTRMSAAASSLEATTVPMTATSKDGRVNRMTLLEGEETAEGALLRGH